jgi:hypothetical protein
MLVATSSSAVSMFPPNRQPDQQNGSQCDQQVTAQLPSAGHQYRQQDEQSVGQGRCVQDPPTGVEPAQQGPGRDDRVLFVQIGVVRNQRRDDEQQRRDQHEQAIYRSPAPSADPIIQKEELTAIESRSDRPPRSSLSVPGRRRDLGRLRTRGWIPHIGSAACRARRHTATGSVGKGLRTSRRGICGNRTHRRRRRAGRPEHGGHRGSTPVQLGQVCAGFGDFAVVAGQD